MCLSELLIKDEPCHGQALRVTLVFVIAVAKCGVVESILSWADFKQSKDLKKTDGTKRQRLTGITKLDDANDAGGEEFREMYFNFNRGRFS